MEHTHNTFISQAFSFAEKRLLNMAPSGPEFKAEVQEHVDTLLEELKDVKPKDAVKKLKDYIKEHLKGDDNKDVRKEVIKRLKEKYFGGVESKEALGRAKNLVDVHAGRKDLLENKEGLAGKPDADKKQIARMYVSLYLRDLAIEKGSDVGFNKGERITRIIKQMQATEKATGVDVIGDIEKKSDKHDEINTIKEDTDDRVAELRRELEKATTTKDKLAIRQSILRAARKGIEKLEDVIDNTDVGFEEVPGSGDLPGKTPSLAGEFKNNGLITIDKKAAAGGGAADFKAGFEAVDGSLNFGGVVSNWEEIKFDPQLVKNLAIVQEAAKTIETIEDDVYQKVDLDAESGDDDEEMPDVKEDDEDLEKVDAEDVAEDFSDGVEDAIKDAKAESEKSKKGEIITKGISSAFRELHKAYKGAENKDEVNEEVEKVVEELLKKGEIDKLDVDLKEGTISASGKVDGVEWEVEEEISGDEEGSEGDDEEMPDVKEYAGLSAEESAFINALPEGMRGFGLLLIKVLKFAEGRAEGGEKPDNKIEPDDVDSPEGIDSEIDELIKESEALTEKLKALKGKLGTNPALQSQINALEQQIAELQAKIDAKKQNKIIIVKSMNDFNDVFGPSGIKVIAIRRGGAPVFEFPTSCSPRTCDLVKGFCNEHKCDSGWVKTGPNSYSRRQMYVKQCRHLFAGCSKDYFQGLHRECCGKPAVNVSFNDNRVYNDNSTDRRNYGTINQIDNSRTAISGKDGGDIDLSGRNVNHVAQNRNDNRVDGRTLVEGNGNATNAGLSGATRRFAGVNKPPVTSNPGKMPKPSGDKEMPNVKPGGSSDKEMPDVKGGKDKEMPDVKDGSPSK